MDAPPTKAELRIAAEARRALAHGVDPAAGEALATAFPADLTPAPGKVAAAYWPYRTEIDLAPADGAWPWPGCGSRCRSPHPRAPARR